MVELRSTALLDGKGEELEVAFSGRDDSEEAGVGGESEVADTDAVKDGIEVGLDERDFVSSDGCGKGGNGNPAEFAGFPFDGAFEQNTSVISRPLDGAETEAETGYALGH